MNLERPHAGKQDVRIGWIHRHLGRAGVFVDKEYAFPVLAAVCRTINAALRLWAIAMAHRGGQYDVGIPRVNNDARDAAGLFESHQLPGLAGVGGFVNSGAHGNVTANRGLARAGPNDVRVGRRDSEGANRGHGLRVEQ